MSATATLSELEVRRELDGFFSERVLAEKLIDSAQGRLEVARLHAEAILRYMTQCRPSKIIPLLTLIEQLVGLQGALFLEAFRPILLQGCSAAWGTLNGSLQQSFNIRLRRWVTSGMLPQPFQAPLRQWLDEHPPLQVPGGDPSSSLADQFGRMRLPAEQQHRLQRSTGNGVADQSSRMRLPPSQQQQERSAAPVQGLQPAPGGSLAWIGEAPVAAVRRRLSDVNRALADLRPLQEERRQLHDRLRALEPQQARPLKLVCWCGQELPKWVLGNTFCGRAFPGGPKGHKLELKRMECNWCRAKKDISLSQAEADEGQWQPIDRVCPACHHDLHGAECRKAGSDVVSVH